MFKEMGGGAGVGIIASNLSKDRENEKIINSLRTEFSKIDVDHNGSIS